MKEGAMPDLLVGDGKIKITHLPLFYYTGHALYLGFPMPEVPTPKPGTWHQSPGDFFMTNTPIKRFDL
jgi:hypothetical protein